MQGRTKLRAARAVGADGRPAVDSVERMLAQTGDAWTFLLLREAFFGVRRFDQFQANLGAAPNIVSGRLKKLVEHGLLSRSPYQQRPVRFEYHLTEKGLDLYPVIVMMMRWGDRWLGNRRGPPLLLKHEPCGAIADAVTVCRHCSKPIVARDVRWLPGPGARPARKAKARVPVGRRSRGDAPA